MKKNAAETDERSGRGPAAGETAASPGARVWLFVLVVSLCGVMALALSVRALPTTALDPWVFVLAILMLASGRFAIKVPGRPATVSVSEVFLFTSMLLFGPAPATLTVAVDGLWVSFTQRHRRLYRTLFNVAEPAVSMLAAGTVFFMAAGMPPFGAVHARPASYMLPALAMTVTYFLLNSLLQAAAIALENRESTFAVWSQHAMYLGINYYAAASIATLAVENASGLSLEVVGLVVPLLILSYSAYKAAASRMEDAQRHIGEVEHLYHATVETLAIAVDAKDQVTHGHLRRVQRHTLALARTLGVTGDIELRALEAASLLHDVGKLAVPDYVLNKPGALSHAEFDRIKLHAAKGAEILTAVEFPYPVVPIVRHHHEQWNGQGYPDGLVAESIPIGARILAVVDCFDALTSDRPYRRRMTDEEAIGILRARSGAMYDPRVVDTFIDLTPSLRREDAAAEGRSADLRVALTARGGGARDRSSNVPGRPLLLGHLGAGMTHKLAMAMPTAEVCLFSPEAGTDFLGVAYATPSIAAAVARLSLRVGEGLAGWVAANRYTIVNSDAGLDLGDAAEPLGLRACTATPVFALGALVAVLSVYCSRPGGFSDDEVRAIGALGQEIGLEVARHEQRFVAGFDDTPARPHIAAVC